MSEKDIVERLRTKDDRKCPLDDDDCKLLPEDPCPVCGDLGTFDHVLTAQAKCPAVSTRLLSLEAAAAIESLRTREREAQDRYKATEDELRATEAKLARVERRNVELEDDASRWRAFWGSARFKMIGSAGFDHSNYPDVTLDKASDYGWLHFGLEVWDRHDSTDDTQAVHGRNLLKCYVDHLVALQFQETDE